LEVIEQLADRVQRQEEKIQQREDEIAALKGEKKRLRFKPTKLDQEVGKEAGNPHKQQADGKTPWLAQKIEHHAAADARRPLDCAARGPSSRFAPQTLP